MKFTVIYFNFNPLTCIHLQIKLCMYPSILLHSAGVRQNMLETVVPKTPNAVVMIVGGKKYRGQVTYISSICVLGTDICYIFFAASLHLLI